MRQVLAGVLVVAAAQICFAQAPTSAPLSPYEAPDLALPETPLDKLVAASWAKHNITPAHPTTDAVFLRRVYLDVIGTLPTAKEARAFLEDKRPNKRQLLIDELLARDEYAMYWSMKWADLLRVKAEFPINLWPNAVQAYHHWIFESLQKNKPVDTFARELLTASGSNFRSPPANFYRAVQAKDEKGIAQAVALTFMASRLEKWPAEDQANFVKFFSAVGFKSTAEWKEEIVFFDAAKVGEGGTQATLPDGTKVKLTAERDPRVVFTDWLLAKDNPRFAEAIANRAWFWLMGRGIVHEPDDMRRDNPPANPQLLRYLANELATSKYDMKALLRVILNSRTYQLSCVPRTKGALAESQFASYPLRRLEAEVLIDAINQITGSTEKYWSPIPEPFSYIPPEQRSINLADASISSSFLDLFARSTRDQGTELERNHRPTPAQRLHMLNSSHIQKKIERSTKLGELFRSRKEPRETVRDVYLTILSREPTRSEMQVLAKYVEEHKDTPKENIIDVVWALLNSDEFIYRH